MTARVERLALTRAAGESMLPQDAVRLVAGVGVEGDRYATGRGHWTGWPDAEVTLVEAETAEALGVDALALRRNVVTRGVRLDALVGRTLGLGTARLRGVRPCDPCGYLENLLQLEGLARELAGKGGLRAAVVRSGEARPGDALVIVD